MKYSERRTPPTQLGRHETVVSEVLDYEGWAYIYFQGYEFTMHSHWFYALCIFGIVHGVYTSLFRNRALAMPMCGVL